MTQLEKLLEEKNEVLFSLKKRWKKEKDFGSFQDYQALIYEIFAEYGFVETFLFKTFLITTRFEGEQMTIKVFNNGEIEIIQ